MLFFRTIFLGLLIIGCQAPMFNNEQVVQVEKKLSIYDFNDHINSKFVKKYFEHKVYKADENRIKHLELFNRVFAQDMSETIIFNLDRYYPLIDIEGNNDRNSSTERLFSELNETYFNVFDKFLRSQGIILDKDADEFKKFEAEKKVQLKAISLIYIIGFVLVDEEMSYNEKNKIVKFSVSSLNTDFEKFFETHMDKSVFEKFRDEFYNSKIEIEFKITEKDFDINSAKLYLESEKYILKKVSSEKN